MAAEEPGRGPAGADALGQTEVPLSCNSNTLDVPSLLFIGPSHVDHVSLQSRSTMSFPGLITAAIRLGGPSLLLAEHASPFASTRRLPLLSSEPAIDLLQLSIVPALPP